MIRDAAWPMPGATRIGLQASYARGARLGLAEFLNDAGDLEIGLEVRGVPAGIAVSLAGRGWGRLVGHPGTFVWFCPSD